MGSISPFKGYVTLRLGSGNGSFGTAVSTPVLVGTGLFNPLNSIAIGDINGDGASDLSLQDF